MRVGPTVCCCVYPLPAVKEEGPVFGQFTGESWRESAGVEALVDPLVCTLVEFMRAMGPGVNDQFTGYTATLLQLPTVLPVETEHACPASVGYSGQPLQAPDGSVPHDVLVLFVVG